MINLACLLSLVSFTLASPFDPNSQNQPRSNGNAVHLARRHEYVVNSGSNINVNITVPINRGAVASSHLLDIRIPYTNFIASGWSNGGGDGQTISGGFFSGRISGRGTRNEIYGTARYGSGYGTYTPDGSGEYHYEPDYTLGVAGRSFPHGFPPILWGNYTGNSHANNTEYVSDSDLPGAAPAKDLGIDGYPYMTVEMAGFRALKGNQSWAVITDGQTAKFLFEVLQYPVDQGGCAIERTVLSSLFSMFNTSDNSTSPADRTASPYFSDEIVPLSMFIIYPWNVLQYYRGSSIALANSTYNNLYSHNQNNNTDYWASTPLDTTGVDMDFLNCLNQTIAAAAPIINPSLVVRDLLTPGQKGGIAGGAVAAVCILVILAGLFYRYHQKKLARTNEINSRSRSLLGRGKETGIAETPDTDSTLNSSYVLEDRRGS